MPATTHEIDFGQIWRNGETIALIVDVQHQAERTVANMIEIIDGRADGVRFDADVVDGVPRFNGLWGLQATLPWIRCTGSDAAYWLAEFLKGKGLHDVLVKWDRVAVSLDPPSVIKLAEDAFERGWATDSEAAATIRRLG